MMRRIAHLAPLLICCIGALVYWQGLRGGFIFDDFPNLVEDPDWKVTTLDPVQWLRAATSGISSQFGRPLAMLSFAANYYFTGLDPYWLKLTGLALHLLNGVLVYLLCRQILAVASSQDQTNRWSDLAPLLLALAWTLHPLQVSSVLYVVQRMEVGACTGVLLSLIGYVKARRNQQLHRNATWWWLLAGASAFVGLGFKESAILTPAYTLALELTFFRFRTTTSARSRWLVGLYTLGLTAAVAIFLLRLLPSSVSPEAYAFRPFTMTERLATQVHVLLMYLGQILLPLPSKLLFYYDNYPFVQALPLTLVKLSGLATLLVAALMARRHWPLFTLGVLWFFAAHALTSNVMPLELAFEHRNYFALLGVLLSGSQLLKAACTNFSAGTRTLLATSILLFLAFLTAIQASTWSNPLRLATSLASMNPNSPRASYEFAVQLIRSAGDDHDSPLVSLALTELDHTSKLPLAPPLAEQAIIQIKGRTGESVHPEVWESFRTKLSSRTAGPQEVSALHGVLDCRLAGTCHIDDNELLNTFLTALEHNPKSAVIHSMYANFALNLLGDSDLAIRMTREAIQLAPAEAQYQVNLLRMLTATDADSAEIRPLIDRIRTMDRHGQYSEEIEKANRRASRP